MADVVVVDGEVAEDLGGFVLQASHPALAEVLQKLGGAISTDEMRKLNYEVDGQQRDKKNVVREWLKAKGLI